MRGALREGRLWGSCLTPGPPEPHTPAAALWLVGRAASAQGGGGAAPSHWTALGSGPGGADSGQGQVQPPPPLRAGTAPQASLNWEPALTDNDGAPSFQLVLVPSSRPGRNQGTLGPECHRERALEHWWRVSLEAPSSGPSGGSLDDKPPRTWRSTEEDPQAGVLVQGQIRGLRDTRWLLGMPARPGARAFCKDTHHCRSHVLWASVTPWGSLHCALPRPPCSPRPQHHLTAGHGDPACEGPSLCSGGPCRAPRDPWAPVPAPQLLTAGRQWPPTVGRVPLPTACWGTEEAQRLCKEGLLEPGPGLPSSL